MAKYIPLDDERTLSVKQFCEVEGLTIDDYLSIRDCALAPTEFCLATEGVAREAVCRITPEERRKWHERLRTKEYVRSLSHPGAIHIIRRYDDPGTKPDFWLMTQPVAE